MVYRQNKNVAHESIHAPRDPNTLSNYNAWRTTHITANLEIDFEGKKLFGDVVLKMKSMTEGESGEVILDARSVLPFSSPSSSLVWNGRFVISGRGIEAEADLIIVLE